MGNLPQFTKAWLVRNWSPVPWWLFPATARIGLQRGCVTILKGDAALNNPFSRRGKLCAGALLDVLMSWLRFLGKAATPSRERR
jgi:hypothetical protein